MPVSVVRTIAEEEAWERAKVVARKQYPDTHGEQFYRIVMHIYKKMSGYQPRHPGTAARSRRSPL